MLKKLLNVCFLSILFFAFTTQVLAAECEYEELLELKELAEKIEVSQNFIFSEEGNHIFQLKAYNLNKKFFIYFPNGMKLEPEKSEYDFGSFREGTSLTFEVYASNNTNCKNERLRKINIELLKFNEYSLRDECTEYKELDVCKQWTDTSDLTEEEFDKIIAEQKTTESVPKENEYIKFLKNNWFYLIGAVVVVTVVSIVKKKKSIKLDI